MKILVTGGCGFIGSRIVSLLVQENYTVHIVDNLSSGKIENVNENTVNIHVMDIRDPKLEDLFNKEKFDVIIHQAAQTSVPYSINNIYYDADVNINGSVHIIDLAKKYKVNKIIFASTAAVYGEPKTLPLKEESETIPLTPYGLSKLTVEKYLEMSCNLYGIDYSILRYSNVFGPKQTSLGEGGVISIFLDKIKLDQPIEIFGDGNQTRDFIFVDDVAKANIAAIERENGVYNISRNESTSVNELVSVISDVIGKDIIPLYKSEREGDIRHSILNNKKAIEKLEWEPKISLLEGLQITYDEYNL